MLPTIRVTRYGGVTQGKKTLLSIKYFIFLLTQMFDRHLCWQQLKYSGMLETVKYDCYYF